MFKRYKLLMAIMSLCFSVGAQNIVINKYSSPFDFPLLLSANFGELRPNHFHGGLDIKTKGTEGHAVKSIADGYIARILITHGGYGKALYVNHPNGTTSVYGHVKSFVPRIEEYVQKFQRKNESYNCDIYPEEGQLKFRRGEVIAISGNEGSSAGPHLHLEIRRTKTNEYLNPLPYFKHLIKDTKAPVASSFYVYPYGNEGIVDGGTSRVTLSASSLSRKISAWGKVYIGVRAKDYMDNTSNFYGVYSVQMLVDGKEVFAFKADSVSANENRMINSLLDYRELMTSRACIMRSCRDDGNHLEMMTTDSNSGIIDINEERDFHVKYVLKDLHGNRRSYTMTINGKKQQLRKGGILDDSARMLYTGKANVIQVPGMEMVIPKNYIYSDAKLRVYIDSRSDEVSNSYTLDAGYTPLHSYCPVSIAIRQMLIDDGSKYFVECKSGKQVYPVGGKYEDGWVKASIRNCGTYSVAIDTVSPSIMPLNVNMWRKHPEKICFSVKDNESGIKDYKVYIDGEYALFWLKRGQVVIQAPEKVKKEKAHLLEIVVTDGCGNIMKKQIKF